jgi:hypothetical protein
MSPDEDTCPHCGAVVRRDAPWCTLCLTSLRPGPVVQDQAAEPAGLVAVPVGGPAESTPDPLTGPLPVTLPGTLPVASVGRPPGETSSPAPVVGEPAPRRGRHAAGPADEAPPAATAATVSPVPAAQPGPVDGAAPEATEESVDVMLSLLRAEHAQEPSVPFADAMSEPATKVVVIFGGMAVLMVLGLLVMLVLGRFT